MEEDKVTGLPVYPELANTLTLPDKVLIKEGYKTLRDMSFAYRDFEGTIDGIAFTRNKPEAVKAVQEIQQKLALLSAALQKITGLSTSEQVELSNLSLLSTNPKLMTDADIARLAELKKSNESKKAIAIKHNDILVEFFEAKKKIQAMSTYDVTHYYTEQKQDEENALAKSCLLYTSPSPRDS